MRRRRHGRRPRGQGGSLIEVVEIDAARARTVRWPVLRSGRPEADAIFPQDELPGTAHFGAYEGERLVAVATFFPDPCPGRDALPAWRVRGMATVPDRRGHGAGRALVERGASCARERGARLLWCNGRLDAEGFYRRLGFAVDGGLFDPHGTGPHHRFVLDLESP